jgi:hypothetical protein
MRTVIDLDEKALAAAQKKSRADGISLDEAASSLILKGAGSDFKKTSRKPGVFKSTGGRYTSADVAAALEND